MKKIIGLFIILLCFCTTKAQQTEVRYLSGTGPDHTVKWNFWCSSGMNSQKWSKIDVPSCWEQQGFGGYTYGRYYIYKEHEKEKQYDAYREHDFCDEYGIYRHCFDVPDTWKGKQISIVFEGVMTDAEVKINDVIAGPVHQGSFYRFSYDITDRLKFGKTNLMEVTVKKQSSNIVMMLTLSGDSIYDGLYLTNYANLNLVDQLTRVPGVGAVDVMGAGDYSMRVWLNPETMRIRNITPQQVYAAIQSQNMEVSAGYVGQPIGSSADNDFQYTLNIKGRLSTPEEFGDIILRVEDQGKVLRLRDVAKIELGSAEYGVVS